MVEKTFDTIRLLMILMSFARLPLILISLKYRGICRFYFYYQVVFLSLEWCLPRNYGEVATNILFSDNVLNFCLLYYDFWPSCIGLLIVSAFQASMSVVHYGQEIDWEFIISFFMLAFWQFFNFLACHFVIISVGLLYVNAEMMRKSHEQILSNLKEGVVTVDKSTG